MAMTNKHIHQLLKEDGTPAAPATSAPGWCIHEGVPVASFPKQKFGKVFAEPTFGNKVDFYVTGQEYFSHLAAAIRDAKHTIFITGWQVNFDVQLVTETKEEKNVVGMKKKVTKWKTLFECLEAAIEKNPALRVYVMPWLSPKVGVNNGDFETMLAIFQLNAGRKGKRAFALPAIGQSDMPGGLGIGFSHHQKLVVVDHERAFMGGIDIAYGRRDDGKFSLAHNGRFGNELYNICVPSIDELSNLDKVDLLTTGELLAACFDGKIGSAAAWWFSTSGTTMAAFHDATKAVGDFKKDVTKHAGDWWTKNDITPEFVYAMQDVPVDIAQAAAKWFYHELDARCQGELENFRKAKGDRAADILAAVVSYLQGKSMEELKPEIRSGTLKVLEALMIATMSSLSAVSQTNLEPYEYLRDRKKMLPVGGKVISTAQPRMPWHDVHCSMNGPSVSHLSRNFVRRWNGVAARYERSYTKSMQVSGLTDVLAKLGLDKLGSIQLPRAPAPPAPSKQPIAGKDWVQVLRSAPVTMQHDEALGNDRPAPKAKPERAQDNCMQAMLTAIQGAQKFIYIEGQFFQAEYGVDLPADAPLSGPMAALTDIKASPGYEKYARLLGIHGVPLRDIPSKLRWSQVDNIMRDVKGKGADFINDLHRVLGSFATVQASMVMGKNQKALLNPLGEALAKKIERQILDGKPFHVYMVLPVHPEGRLDTLNIMNQVHLTMQSLVFGSDSLVNRISRALMIAELRKEKKIGRNEAQQIVAGLSADKVITSTNSRWKSYLTLLNLRNWSVIEGRPVTEQIYVHSKLLIADDRVAIVGSANINDRGQLGDRDSELAATVWGDEEILKKLDGATDDPVSLNVQSLRSRLWKKIFGFMDGAVPASALASVIEKPAAPATWKAIQKVADANAVAYSVAFPFLPTITGKPSSLWPTWDKASKRLKYHMPFNERFWRDDSIHDESFTWDANGRAPESAPKGIEGFIVSLPTTWTAGESNISGMNNFLMAGNFEAPRKNGEESKEKTMVASNTLGAAPTVS
jgi:phospholipase D1/2